MNDKTCVVIKPLVWEKSALCKGRDGLIVRVAMVADGCYRIIQNAPPGLLRPFIVEFNKTLVSGADSLEQATASAQADYERRILSAIDPRPEAAVKAEALRDAVGWIAGLPRYGNEIRYSDTVQEMLKNAADRLDQEGAS